MQTNVLLPQVELNMESVVVLKWLAGEGAFVEADQAIMEVETQKATVEVPSPQAGFLRRHCVKEGETIGEKALLCIITATADEKFDEPAASFAQSSGTASKAIETASVAESGPPGAIRAAPAARKLASELNVDLAKVRGTGPQGRITVDDVRSAKSAPAPATAPSGEWTPLSPTRLALIAQMQKSLAEIPQIHIFRQLDVTPLTIKTEGITFTHRLIVAVAASLAKHPALRTMIQGDKKKSLPVSVAVAIDTGDGLIAPALRDTDRLSLAQVSSKLKDFQARVAGKSLRREELTDAPFAITNLGMLGVDFFSPFVFHGQTAVMSVGRATDGVGGRKVSWFGLAVDHRVVDGAEAARFLQTLQTEMLKA